MGVFGDDFWDMPKKVYTFAPTLHIQGPLRFSHLVESGKGVVLALFCCPPPVVEHSPILPGRVGERHPFPRPNFLGTQFCLDCAVALSCVTGQQWWCIPDMETPHKFMKLYLHRAIWNVFAAYSMVLEDYAMVQVNFTVHTWERQKLELPFTFDQIFKLIYLCILIC